MRKRISQPGLPLHPQPVQCQPAALLRTLLVSICVLLLLPALQAQNNKLWLTAGGDPSNTRNAANETKISAGNAGSLAVKWAFTTEGDVSANPAVDGQAVYFPDWGGNLYKVDAASGALIWKKSFKD